MQSPESCRESASGKYSVLKEKDNQVMDLLLDLATPLKACTGILRPKASIHTLYIDCSLMMKLKVKKR